MPMTEKLNNYLKRFSYEIQKELEEAYEINQAYSNNAIDGISKIVQRSIFNKSSGALSVATYAAGFLSKTIITIGNVIYDVSELKSIQRMSKWVNNRDEIKSLIDALNAELKKHRGEDIKNNSIVIESFNEKVWLFYNDIIALRQLPKEEKLALIDADKILNYMCKNDPPVTILHDESITQRVNFFIKNVLCIDTEEILLPSNMQGLSTASSRASTNGSSLIVHALERHYSASTQSQSNDAHLAQLGQTNQPPQGISRNILG
jgi:hypothetical protein